MYFSRVPALNSRLITVAESKTSRLSKNPASYLTTWSQLLEGFGFEGLFLSHPVQRKPIQSVGNKVSTTNLEEPAFPPGERALEGCEENSPVYITESYPEVVSLPLHLKEVKKEVNRGCTTRNPKRMSKALTKAQLLGYNWAGATLISVSSSFSNQEKGKRTPMVLNTTW